MGLRPRTRFVKKLKSRRCPKCKAKMNNQRVRCPKCTAPLSRPKK